MKDFAIIGGGIGGLTLAIAMQRKGMNVTVYESASQFKPLGAGIGLAANAIKAFIEIGIDEEIIAAGKQIERVFIKDVGGNEITFSDAAKLTRKFGVVNNFTIHRADLHDVLSKLIKPGTVTFGKTCVDFEQNENNIVLHFSDGSKATADYIIAYDGIHSPIRRKLIPSSVPRYAGYTCWRGVTDNIPEGFDFSETTETWGPGKRFGVVPLDNNRVYWFATINAKANDPMMRNATKKDLLEHFGKYHFPIPEILEMTNEDQIIWNDIIDLKPIKKFSFGRVILMGDAAHATTPNMGQGACMAIEDAATLANGLMNYSPEGAFQKFEKHRIRRTTGIVNQSWIVGKIAQLENPILRFVRNAVFRNLPESVIEKQVASILDVSFEY